MTVNLQRGFMCKDKKQKMKETLLVLLEDKAVQDKILEIAHRDRHNSLSQGCNQKHDALSVEAPARIDVNKLKDDLQQSEKNIEVLQQRFKSLTSELEDRNKEYNKTVDERNKLKSKLFEAQNELKKINDTVARYHDIYKKFQNLEPDTRLSLKGIFKGEGDLWKFIFCGILPENIEALWGLCSNKALNGELSELDKLKSIFDFFFGIYNTLHDTPPFHRQIIQIGMVFDGDKYTRSSDGKVAGKISEIILPGYEHSCSGKIVKKSIVKIG